MAAPIDLGRIQKEQHAWADLNFPSDEGFYRSCVGVIEEVGELAAVILKREQGIRSDRTSDEQLRDALGDACIYLFHALSSAPSPIDVGDWSKIVTQERLTRIHSPLQQVIRISMAASALQSYSPTWLGGMNVFSELARMAHHYGWDLNEIVDETWEVVKQRNWVDHPGNGVDA